MNSSSGDTHEPDRREGERRRTDAEREHGEEALRPVQSTSAVEHARRLMELGEEGIEEGPDGRLWATGADRREHDRRE